MNPVIHPAILASEQLNQSVADSVDLSQSPSFRDTLDMAQLGPSTQLSELIELACRWNKSFGIDLGNVEVRVLIKEPTTNT